MPRIFLWALIVIVAIAPLPLGSNRPLAWSLLALEVGLLMIAWSVYHLWTSQPLPVSVRRIRTPLLLFTLACAWVLVQLIPNIPFGLAHPAWQEVNTFFTADVPERITIDPDRTVTTFMRWLTYAGVFWLALQLGRDRTSAHTALRAFATIAAAYAIYGLIALFAAGDTLLMYEKWAGKGSVTSTFVNRNSYATFAGLGVVATAALIFAASPRPRAEPLLSRQRLYDVLTHSLTQSGLMYVWLFLSLTALLLTGSRAGALSTLFALAMLGLQLMWVRRLNLGSRLTGIALFCVVGALTIGFSGNYLGDRLAEGGGQKRLEVYEQTLSAIEDHTLLGSGLGSFPQIFQLYRETETLRARYVARAHNTYLENALELGLPAVFSLVGALGFLAWQCGRGVFQRSRDRHFPAMGLSVTVLVGLHALVDFSLQIPAVVVAYMFLIGIAVAQSSSSRRK